MKGSVKKSIKEVDKDDIERMKEEKKKEKKKALSIRNKRKQKQNDLST